jgi:RNA ligase
MERLYKYPRTPHLAGSRVQPGDEDLRVISPDELLGEELVIEEKLDGSNSGISFDPAGRLLLQSRGHYLDGGPRERHFALLKSWATSHQGALWGVLGERYVMYGEWVYAKHTIFYDALTHYFYEFDVFDKQAESFLSTIRRRELLGGLPVVSAPVVMTGRIRSVKQFRALIKAPAFQTAGWQERLREVCESRDLNHERALDQTDGSGLMEGLYFKVENEERVIERYKFVHAGFSQAVDESNSHWLERPIIPNQLRDGTDIFARH